MTWTRLQFIFVRVTLITRLLVASLRRRVHVTSRICERFSRFPLLRNYLCGISYAFVTLELVSVQARRMTKEAIRAVSYLSWETGTAHGGGPPITTWRPLLEQVCLAFRLQWSILAGAWVIAINLCTPINVCTLLKGNAHENALLNEKNKYICYSQEERRKRMSTRSNRFECMN